MASESVGLIFSCFLPLCVFGVIRMSAVPGSRERFPLLGCGVVLRQGSIVFLVWFCRPCIRGGFCVRSGRGVPSSGGDVVYVARRPAMDLHPEHWKFVKSLIFPSA
jgi:hypothetical protein